MESPQFKSMSELSNLIGSIGVMSDELKFKNKITMKKFEDNKNMLAQEMYDSAFNIDDIKT